MERDPRAEALYARVLSLMEELQATVRELGQALGPGATSPVGRETASADRAAADPAYGSSTPVERQPEPVAVGFVAGTSEPASVWLGTELIRIRRVQSRRRDGGAERLVVDTDRGTLELRREGRRWFLL